MGMKLPADYAAQLIREDDERKLSVPPPLDCEEKVFQAAVVALAKHRGWLVFHPYDMRRSEAGWPDLALVKPPSCLILAELKTEKGRVRPEQTQWLEALGMLQAPSNYVVRVRLWRPRDWEAILNDLK